MSNGDSGKFERTQGTPSKSSGDMPWFPLPVREPGVLVSIVKEECLKFSLELRQNSMGSFTGSITLWVFFFGGGEITKISFTFIAIYELAPFLF